MENQIEKNMNINKLINIFEVRDATVVNNLILDTSIVQSWPPILEKD